MKISIVIPVHYMANAGFFLKRCLDSIVEQTFKDCEVVVVEEGSFSENVNAGIKKARGELIKFLCMDDWLADENSLQRIVDTFKNGWLISGCSDNPHPYWTDDIWVGNNKLGSPSCLTIQNERVYFTNLAVYNGFIFFDETLEWMVDTDFYMKLYKRYGQPTILDEVNVGIGIHPGQMTHLISDETKIKEVTLMKEKYG